MLHGSSGVRRSAWHCWLRLSAGVAAHDSPQPLGDGNISSSPERGHVFSCQTNFRRGGVVKPQPWIRGDTWYPAEKVTVDGTMLWPNAELSIAIEGNARVVRANGLPSHTTGGFPIDRSSAAYRHDRNPNGISAQLVLLRLPAEPRLAASSTCLPGGPIGFALTGVAIYNALDAAGLDAAAHEVQDKCSGHPQRRGQYHYHDFSHCMTDSAGTSGQHSQLVGYANDGFGIYGLFGDGGVRLSNADLDACHGHTGSVAWDGAVKSIYHYHMTGEYPYSLGCFKGRPVDRGRGPGPDAGPGFGPGPGGREGRRP